MKTEYNIKDTVWIHMGERKLVEGRVVEIFDLQHVGYPSDREFYVIEIQTGIDNIFEVRDFEQISPDAKGPIQLFRKHSTSLEQRYLKKVGVVLPIDTGVSFDEMIEEDEISADKIHAAMEKSAQDTMHQPLNLKAEKPKRRYFKKKPKA
jgi:hypothetical protein